MNIRSKIFGGESPTEQPVLTAKRPKGVRADELHSIPVTRQARRLGNSRFEDRHRLADEAVEITHGSKTYQAQLINLSGGGAMLTAPGFSPNLWDKLELRLGADGTIECAVCWIKGDRIGLEFAHETRLDCGAGEQAALLREVIGKSFPQLQFDAPASGSGEPVEDESRIAARHPLIWSGVLHHDHQSTNVRLRNISATGAMVESHVAVRVGAEPLLELGDAASVPARVEWAVGDQVGLRFLEPFDMRLLAASKPDVAPSQWVRPTYLASSNASDSPWDANWDRLTIDELSQHLEGFLKR